MTKLLRSFILFVMIVLTLSSCIFGPGDATAEIKSAATPTVAPTTIELTVKTDATYLTAANQIIKYLYVIKNTGAGAVPGTIAVTGATCPAINSVGNLDGAFDPGEVFTCTFDYTVTQADIDKGSVTNITTAVVSGISSNAVTTTISKAPPVVLNLAKTANPTTFDAVGQVITYTYVISNSGTSAVGPTQFTVSDNGFSAPFNCGEATATLQPNGTLTCTATYTIAQANLDAGSVVTSATASGGGVSSAAVNVTITKGAVAPVPTNNTNLTAGSTVQHKVVSGEWVWQIARCYGADPAKTLQANPQLTDPAYISPDITITVPNIGSAGKIYGPPCVGTYTVQSGDTWASIAQKYNADQTVLQMVNKNVLTTGGAIKVPLNSAGATVITSKTLTLVTSASPATYNQLGQVITITYVIKNSGSVNLGPAQFTVTDTLIGSAPFNCGLANATLIPNGTVTCSANYTINQANLDAASVSNSATASGGGAGPSQTASTTIIKQ